MKWLRHSCLTNVFYKCMWDVSAHIQYITLVLVWYKFSWKSFVNTSYKLLNNGYYRIHWKYATPGAKKVTAEKEINKINMKGKEGLPQFWFNALNIYAWYWNGCWNVVSQTKNIQLWIYILFTFFTYQNKILHASKCKHLICSTLVINYFSICYFTMNNVLW